MGKKMKNKPRNPHKVQHRVPVGSPRAVSEPTDPKADLGDEGVRGTEICKHNSKGNMELNRILLRIESSSNVDMRCEDCREEPMSKRGKKDKGKQHKKKGGGSRTADANSDSHFIWVCLDCNRCFCGGAVSDSVPYGHARRHAKQERHSWAVRSDNPLLCWCFPCDSVVPIELIERGTGETVVTMDGGDVENSGEVLILESTKGYTVRGLVNLGNTCFFNSVMQNLFAVDIFRDYLASLDMPSGPLTMSLKKLFYETSAMADYRNVLSPKSLFGCICVKAPQFRGYQQQDSHELLRYLLDGLYTEEISARKSLVSSDEQDKVTSNSGPTFVDAIFGGQLSSTVSCVECGHTSIVYEPFLDLSLPVPSKKPPSKKAPPFLPKRTKLPLREGNRARKAREKGVAKPSSVIDQSKTESCGSTPECSASCTAASEQEKTVDLKEEDFMWMDYIGPSTILDGADSVSQKCEVSIAQRSENRQIFQGENNVQCTSNLQIDACSKEVMVSSYCCGETSCRDEVSSSCIQDSAVLLLPYKEDSTAEESVRKTAGSQNPDNVASTDALVKESSPKNESVVGCEQAEEDVYGFGDLFNEPEITSELKRESGMGEEVETTLWTGNICESNQDEVDNTNAPVSIDSCLALFTKPELLSDEHAWHCEHCSEILLRQDVGHRKGKRQTVARIGQLEASNSQVGEGEVRSIKVSPNLEVDSVDSIVFKGLGNGKMATTPENIVSHVERLDNANENVDAAQKPLSLFGGSDATTCSHGQARKGMIFESSNPIVNDQSHCPDVLQEGGDVAESDHTSQYLSCTSAHEKTISQESSSNQENGCSISDLNSVGCDVQALEDASSSSPNHMGTILRTSCDNDNFSKVNQVGKKSSECLGKVYSPDDSRGEPESRKVKRDATKRILIYRAPPILTIHLKRFSQDARGRLNKLSGHVNFQETIDLRPYMDPRSGEKEKCYYRLIGLVEHSGSMTGGHYVAYVRGGRSKGKTDKGAWFYASDAHVRETSLSEVLQCDAYILFYERIYN